MSTRVSLASPFRFLAALSATPFFPSPTGQNQEARSERSDHDSDKSANDWNGRATEAAGVGTWWDTQRRHREYNPVGSFFFNINAVSLKIATLGFILQKTNTHH